jgi:hypothetical protein
MKPVHQTIFTHPNGNCLQACVASILEVEIDQVPNFTVGDGHWWDRFSSYFGGLGIAPVAIDRANKSVPGEAIGVPLGYSILTGKSPRGDFNHAVVALDGKVVHDPFPNGAGVIGDLVDEIIFVVKDLHLFKKLQQQKDRQVHMAFIRATADMACAKAFDQRNEINDAVNWGDLSCHGVEYVVDDTGREYYRVTIEEAAPGCMQLIEFIDDRFHEFGFEDIEVVTEW